MAIQYYMRAFNTSLSQFVDWVVNDAPDTTGLFSGYPTGQLSNIVVNRIVSSKVDNFLKPNHSLGGADGYYFHVNSYDWLSALTSPVTLPPNLKAGLAVERGNVLVTTVSSATNATPISINTAGAHGLVTGSLVTITGVQGNTAANGTFPIINTGTNSFTLTGSSGNGTYTAGGQVFKPVDFSTLTWDEVGQTWRFVVNTNGDGTTLGASQELRVLNLNIDGYISLGTDPADTGIIRLPNNQFIAAESNPTGTDLILIGADTLNRIRVGSAAGDVVYVPGRVVVDGYISHDGNSTSVAQSGFIREQNNTTIVAFRNQLQNADIAALSSTSGNLIVLGDAVNSGINYNTSTTNLHNFQVATTTFLELGNLNGAVPPFNNSAFARFSQGAAAPVIGQTAATSGSGQTMTVQAQATSAASQTGGILALASGRGTGGSGFDGAVEIYTGAPTGGGAVKVRVHPNTTSVAANNSTIELFNRVLRFDDTMVLPFILQEATTGATGTNLTIQAQDATTTGGNLLLSSGTGASAGNVIIKTGNTNQIIVSPTLTTILGNLLVTGTTTSVSSTVVEIADRVINLNSSANQFPGTTVPAPTQITGFAIDRGSTNNTTKRDYFGLFWSETDGYWRFAVNTDGYTTQNTLFSTLPTLASAYVAQPSAAVSVNATLIPTVAGFRSLNNTVHSASRNATGTQDLILVSTDATNHLIWGAGTQNAGHIFDTTTGTIYDFHVNSVSTYTITPQSAGTTTLQATAGVTALVYTHAATGGATGANTTISAQGAATTGGNLILSSGAATTAGNVNIQTGAVSRIIVHPTFTEFRDSAEAYRITPVSSGATTLEAINTATSVVYRQGDIVTASATGAVTTVQAQNATGTTSTGGNLVLTSGTGTTIAGSVIIQTGGTARITTGPTSATLNLTNLQFSSSVVNPLIRQNDDTTNSITGDPLTIQSQNATGTTTTGGALNLTSGSGTTANGAVNLQVAGTTIASVITNKFVFNRGRRRNITSISSGGGTYAVLASDDYIAITTLAAPFTINLPSGPTVGDTYEVKDTVGNASISNVTVSGNGANIDGAASIILSQAYASVVLTYTGTQWSVS